MINNISAKIYKPAKTAMQSGKGKTKNWVIEFDKQSANVVDNLMGWQGSDDMKREVKLRFDTKEAAIASGFPPTSPANK